jgi:hypothetical protein
MTIISCCRGLRFTFDSVLSDKVLIPFTDNSEDPYEVFTYLSAGRGRLRVPYRAAERNPNSSDIVVRSRYRQVDK